MEKAKEKIPTLIVRRVVKAKRDRVFAAWTKPELMNQWFHPMGGRSTATNELKVKGKYSNEMTFNPKLSSCSPGEVSDELKHVVHYGEYLEISPPEKVVFTWNSPIVKDSIVTIELTDLGESTEIKITHELLETEDLRKAHNGGWDQCLDNLVVYLE